MKSLQMTGELPSPCFRSHDGSKSIPSSIAGLGCLAAGFPRSNHHCAVGEQGVVEAVQEHGLQPVQEVHVSDSWAVAAEHV